MIDLKYQLVYHAALRRLLSGDRELTPGLLSEETGLPPSIVEEALQYIGLAPEKATPTELVIKAWKRGFDIVELALSLGWQELEGLCASIFEEAGYEAARNLRFKASGRRFEVDVVAWREGFVVAADCKKWSRARRSALRKAALDQRVRASLLAQNLQNVSLPLPSGRYTVCPAVIAVYGAGREVYGGVPIVALRELRGFLAEIESHVVDIGCFEGVKVSLV